MSGTNIKTEFANIDVSLSSVENSIEDEYKKLLEKYNDSDSVLENHDYNKFNEDIDKTFSSLQLRIQSQKALIKSEYDDLNDIFLSDMDVSNGYIKDRINYYENRKKYLHDLMMKYNNIEGRLVDAQSNKYYILFLIWSIIFIIVLTTVFTNIIETRSSMNLLSKAILFIFIIYLVHMIIKNILLYMNGYSVIK